MSTRSILKMKFLLFLIRVLKLSLCFGQLKEMAGLYYIALKLLLCFKCMHISLIDIDTMHIISVYCVSY